MDDKSELTQSGMAVMNLLQPDLADNVVKHLEKIETGLSAIITDYAFGMIVARKGLDLKMREMLTVASLISIGTATTQLKLHMKAALNVGASRNELLEVIIQMAVYAGIPAFMNAINVYQSVIDITIE